MLLICPTFYCLSNIVLLICFSILAYRQLRGLVLILYDNNQILDQIDKGLYCLCLVASLTVIGITVYPVESLMLLLKGFKMATQALLLYVFLKLTEVDLAHPNCVKVLIGVVGCILMASLYRKSQVKSEYWFALDSWCIPLSQYILTLGMSVCSITSGYFAAMDLREIHLLIQSRVVEPQSSGFHKITYAQIDKRRLYVLILACSSLVSCLFLLVLDTQQILLTSNVCDIAGRFEGVIPQSIGSILSYLAVFGLQPAAMYYLMVWKNMKYLMEKPPEQSLRGSVSVMLELDDYRRL